jgi:DNA-binding protein H-NS
MASINIDKLSLKELQDLEMKVKKAIAAAVVREKEEFRQDVAALAAKRGIAISEVFPVGKAMRGKGGKVAIKYRNRDNPSETWTGRGRQPKWLAAALKKGAKITDFAV